MDVDILYYKLDNLISELTIGVQFSFEHDINHEGRYNAEDYFDLDILPEDQENPFYIDPIDGELVRITPRPLWEPLFNGFYNDQFLSHFESIVKEIFENYQNEIRIERYIGIPNLDPELVLSLLGNVYRRINVDKVSGQYSYQGVKYSELVTQHNFLQRLSRTIEIFYKSLKQKCYELILEGIEKLNVTPVGLKWEKEKKELAELIVSLVELKSIETLDGKKDRKAITAEFSKIFGIDLSHMESLISHTSGNSGSNPGSFLKQLDQAFQTHLSRKLK